MGLLAGTQLSLGRSGIADASLEVGATIIEGPDNLACFEGGEPFLEVYSSSYHTALVKKTSVYVVVL